jgi:hypothetical protein
VASSAERGARSLDETGGQDLRTLPKALFIVGVVLLLLVANIQVLSTDRIDPRLMVQVLVSLVLLGATLYVIVSKSYQPKDKNWAYTTLGMVIGFWLKL